MTSSHDGPHDSPHDSTGPGTGPASAPPPAPGRVLVLNGANLNLLGRREPDVYGTATLADVEADARAAAAQLGLVVDFRQSNHEGVLVDAVQEALDSFDAVVINPAGFTHTSVVLRDALAAVAVPVVEVHLSNVHAREGFRAHSYISAVADAVIIGAGAHGYRLALTHVAHLLSSRR